MHSDSRRWSMSDPSRRAVLAAGVTALSLPLVGRMSARLMAYAGCQSRRALSLQAAPLTFSAG
ncbi:hypothetical protein JOE52_006795 [Bradyrhizobium canariense]|nr:hypothetical protein [Bradyrhizobium canariense]